MRKLLVITLGIALAGLGTVALASRNSSGTYNVSASGTYPFVTGTTISSTTMNSIFSDVSTEMTDSLSRSGKGGMLAPLRCTDGSVSAPSMSFSNETNTGFYRIGSSDVGLTIGGTKRWEHTAVGQIETGWLEVLGTLTVSGKIDRPSLPTIGQQVSTSSGSFSSSSGSWTDVTNLSVTLTTTGRPVVITVQPDGSANPSQLALGSAAFTAYVRVYRDGTTAIATWRFTMGTNAGLTVPFSGLVLDPVASGSHTYKVQVQSDGANSITTSYFVIAAYEL